VATPVTRVKAKVQTPRTISEVHLLIHGIGMAIQPGTLLTMLAEALGGAAIPGVNLTIISTTSMHQHNNMTHCNLTLINLKNFIWKVIHWL